MMIAPIGDQLILLLLHLILPTAGYRSFPNFSMPFCSAQRGTIYFHNHFDIIEPPILWFTGASLRSSRSFGGPSVTVLSGNVIYRSPF